MDSLDTIVEQLQSKYVEPAKNKTDDKAAILVSLGYLIDSFQVVANASELIKSAFETFRLDLDDSTLLTQKEIRRLKDLYPVDVDLKLLEYCVDIDEGPKFDKLPEFGSQNLRTRILHYRLNLLGLYEQPIHSYFSAKSYSALSELSSLIGKNLLATLNLLSDIQEFTCAYLKQTGYQHPIVISQCRQDKINQIEDFSGAFKRSVKRELGGHHGVFENLKDGLFKRNDDKVDLQEALSILKNNLNSFNIRLIQVHQRILGLYDGAIDGNIGPITIESLQNIIKSYEQTGEKLAQNLDHGDILCLFGELGSGKTTFARSVIRSIYKKQNAEAPHSIKSPSFPILITYEVNNIEIYHYDLYRISNTSELFELNIFENLENSITLIEWPEIILKEIKSKKYFSVKFDIIDSFSRKINHNIFL